MFVIVQTGADGFLFHRAVPIGPIVLLGSVRLLGGKFEFVLERRHYVGRFVAVAHNELMLPYWVMLLNT